MLIRLEIQIAQRFKKIAAGALFMLFSLEQHLLLPWSGAAMNETFAFMCWTHKQQDVR